MKTDEILKLIGDKDFLDKIYRFSYHRCNTSFDAEDLCSDIVLAVISAIQGQSDINNFYGFVWTIAHRVYADFCEKRNKIANNISIQNTELQFANKENEIDNLIEETADREQLKKIFSEIAFLSKIYREVMVMYYIDEMKIKDISAKLDISETTVKQRLFSARNTVRSEVEAMNKRNLSLKPMNLKYAGTGSPCGNNPAECANRTLSQNLIYLCKERPKTAKELSDELCIPMLYVEEELEIQCYGQNGKYGMLRKLDNGKYTINVLVIDYEEYDAASKIYEKYLPQICNILKENIRKYNGEILNLPFLSKQTDTRFILWSMIVLMYYNLTFDVGKTLKEKYFSDVQLSNRPYSMAAFAYDSENDGTFFERDFYGNDGINSSYVGGYKTVHMSNIYSDRIKPHFRCGHNISTDEKILLLLKTIGGLPIDDLSENEKEIAAKCIECGYLRKAGDIIEPKILVLDKKDNSQFLTIVNKFHNMLDIKEKIAEEMSIFIKKHIPQHLIADYFLYNQLIANARSLSKNIDMCIEEDILTTPENDLCAEGVMMLVEKE